MILAQRIASHPPRATRGIKRLMSMAQRDAVTAARSREEDAFEALFSDPSANPGHSLVSGLES